MKNAFVAVVDDDESIRESLPDLLGQLGFDAGAFASADEFLNSGRIPMTDCMLLDVAMPGMSGPELQQELTERGEKIRIIFITAMADEGMRRQLLARGAVDCLFKPFDASSLQAALHAALDQGQPPPSAW
jgi:FixJ family two-component response regulator